MKKLLLLFLLMPLTFFSQTQIGQDIDGEVAEDTSGYSTSISLDGSIVAIGAYGNDGNGSFSGHVRVYENIENIWTQIGQDIDGEYSSDFSGISVSLSSDGSIVAIGADLNSSVNNYTGHVKVYKNIGGVWTQLGEDIDGEASGDGFGRSISLSSDGSIVAIGAYKNDGNGDNSGNVRVYENIEGVWTQIGQDIDGEAAVDQSGISVSLSSDGFIVAIGANGNDGNGNSSGHVRVYKNIGGTWTQIGQDIDGEAAEDQSGTGISISSSGYIVAIGALFNDGKGDNSGHVRVYENIEGIWTQIGQDIDGEFAGDISGRCLSISSNGLIVAIGGEQNDGNGNSSGHVRICKNIEGIWTQIGQDINGEAAGDRFGRSLSISSDGTIIAIGASDNDGNGNSSGHVRVYDLSAVLSTESFKQNYFSYYPNPVKDVLKISLNKGLELKQINIYNIQSQYLYSTKSLKVDTKNLKTGIYFIEIETNQGKSAKKIVVE